MKKLLKPQSYLALFTLILISLFNVVAYAQDSASSSSTSQTSTTTTQSTFVMQPWMWIVGGVVVLIIIIALVSGNKGKGGHTDQVTYTKTTSSSEDV